MPPSIRFDKSGLRPGERTLCQLLIRSSGPRGWVADKARAAARSMTDLKSKKWIATVERLQRPRVDHSRAPHGRGVALMIAAVSVPMAAKTPNPALEPTAASGLRRQAVPSALRASAAAQRER